MKYRQFHTLILIVTILSLFACASAYGSDIYVTIQNSIQKIDSSGNRTTFAACPSGGPSYITFDRNGCLFAAYDYAGVIDKFDSSGHKTTFATGLTSLHGQLGPEGLAFDSAGNLYTANMWDGTVLKFDPSGNKTVFASGLSYPDGLAFDSKGYLYVTDGENIFKYDSSGSKSTFASGLSGLESLAFDSHDNLYASRDNIAFQGSIMKYDQSGNPTVFASSTYLDNPFSIAFDGSDNLYVACYGPYGLVKLDTSANISVVASAPSDALGVAILTPEPCTLILLGLGAAVIRKFRF